MGLSLHAARERIRPELDADLVAFAQKALGRVSNKVVRELLAVASRPEASALYLDALRRLLSTPLLRTLHAPEQLGLIRLFAHTAPHPPMTEKFLELVAHPNLPKLPRREQLRILTYAVGPACGTHAAPGHAATLMGLWLPRAHALQDFLHSSPSGEAVHAFLVEPSRPLHLLRTPANLDLLVVAFGRPDHPSTLSYSRTIYADARGNAEAYVVSPSPYVKSAWKRKDRVNEKVFEARSTILTPLEELELVRWIEDNHVIGPNPTRRPKQAPVGFFLNAQRFLSAVESISHFIASSRGPLRFRRSQMRRGKPVKSRRNIPCATHPKSPPTKQPGRPVVASTGVQHGYSK